MMNVNVEVPNFTVREDYFQNILDKVEKINKRGKTSIEVEVTGTSYEKQGAGYEKYISFDLKQDFSNVINGYTVLGRKFKDLETGAITVSDGVPQEYRNDDFMCNHCGTRRAKKEVYILQHDDGNIIQVGSACIKDFLGDSIVSTIFYYKSLEQIGDNRESYDSQFHSIDMYNEVEKVIAISHEIIKKNGYVSKADSEWKDEPATFTLVKEQLKNSPEPKEESIELAKKIIEWYMTLSNEDSFTFNVQQILESGYVRTSKVALITFLPQSYKRHLIKLAQKEATNNEYVGKVGDKFSGKVTLNKVSSYESHFGYKETTVYIHIFVDDEGHQLIWKTSSACLEEGQRYIISGTIKEHNEYNDTKQTILTRCKRTKI